MGGGWSLQRLYRIQLLWRVGEQRGKAYLAFVEGGRMRLDFVSLKNGLVGAGGLLRAWRGSRASNVQWGALARNAASVCKTYLGTIYTWAGTRAWSQPSTRLGAAPSSPTVMQLTACCSAFFAPMPMAGLPACCVASAAHVEHPARVISSTARATLPE